MEPIEATLRVIRDVVHNAYISAMREGRPSLTTEEQ